MEKSISSSGNRLIAHAIYALAAGFLFYEMALQNAPSIMTDVLMRDLRIDAAGLGLLGGFYFYSYTLMQIPAGMLYDRYSLRMLLTAAIGVCTLGAFASAAASSLLLAEFGRFLLGIGSAFAFIGVLMVASRWFPARYFALLVGVAQLLGALGAMAGEAPLAPLVNAIGWRQTLFDLAFVGIAMTLLAWVLVRDYPKGAEPTQTHTPSLSHVLSGIKEILGSRQTWWVGLYAFSSWGPISAFASLWGVPYLMQDYQISSTLAASAIAMAWIGLAITSPVLGWISDRYGRRNPFLFVMSAIGLVSSILLLYGPALPLPLLFVVLFIFGMATSGQILSFAVIKENNREQVTATAIGFNNMAVVAGGAVFQPFVGKLLHSQWDGTMHLGAPLYQAHDYKTALVVVPICFFIGILVSWRKITETYCRPYQPK